MLLIHSQKLLLPLLSLTYTRDGGKFKIFRRFEIIESVLFKFNFTNFEKNKKIKKYGYFG